MATKKIEVKDVDVLRSLINRRWDPVLLDIALWVAQEYGLCFTQGWRDEGRAGDVHNTDPLRAMDLRSWFYRPDEALEIEARINAIWIYDHNRPEKQCAWIHDSGRGIHFHVQVHPHTKRR